MTPLGIVTQMPKEAAGTAGGLSPTRKGPRDSCPGLCPFLARRREIARELLDHKTPPLRMPRNLTLRQPRMRQHNLALLRPTRRQLDGDNRRPILGMLRNPRKLEQPRPIDSEILTSVTRHG